MTISKAIDPGRVGLSKSLMTSPCERKGFYSETVRDADGRRLQFPMPERVTFGTAVDEAVGYIAFNDTRGFKWSAAAAVALGLTAAREAKGWPLVQDPETFELQVKHAIDLYLVSDDGLQRLRRHYPVRVQGDDGRSLKAGDVIGTPDFLTPNGPVDVKTWSRNDGIKKFWTSPEMGIYGFLWTAQDGSYPERLAYQAYVRVAKPYWIWLEVTDPDEIARLVDFGRATADHWRALLEAGHAELAAADTRFCGDCPFRDPLPEVGHDGCAVGRLVPREAA